MKLKTRLAIRDGIQLKLGDVGVIDAMTDQEREEDERIFKEELKAEAYSDIDQYRGKRENDI